jgi:CO/xanthine dehydrogenase Mo-binding subunit
MLRGARCHMQSSHPFVLSRRSFIEVAGAAGISVVFNRLALAEQAEPTPSAASVKSWSGQPGIARYRIEGLPKVIGQKIYARDFRAKDMGWPGTESVAMILRSTVVDKLYTGLNLQLLAGLPYTVVTYDDIVRDNITQPGFGYTSPVQWPTAWLVQPNTRAVYYGQPVAIVIFPDYATYRQAKRLLQFNPAVLQYGAAAPVPPNPTIYPPTNHLTRYQAPGQLYFSQVLDGKSDPNGSRPVDQRAKSIRQSIANVFTQPGNQTFGNTYSTQVLDPMFMEPEAGLAYLNPDTNMLSLVIGTQATNGDMGDAAGLFTNISCKFNVNTVVLNSCYPGGGFGGRDSSTFPMLLALAAAYAGGPVRIAQDRYEQFQSGLKQLDSSITHSIAVDAQGHFQAFKSSQTLHGGGINNYSQYVTQLCSYCGLSGYRINKAQVDAFALPTPGVISGSMRGFGGPQASFAVESLVDEVAVGLNMDPIALRAKNVLNTGDLTITGGPLTQAITLGQICQLASQRTLWTNRAAQKQAVQQASGKLYGVGFALANQAYGTGTDGVMAGVELLADGTLRVQTNCVDMGNGSATTLAISTAGYLGNNASDISMGQVSYFEPLAFNTCKLPPDKAQKIHDIDLPEHHGRAKNAHLIAAAASEKKTNAADPWDNPCWTASYSMSSSACLTAFHQVHVTEQASLVLLQTGILPAAAALWNLPLSIIQNQTQWQNGLLTLAGRESLSMVQLAQQIYSQGLPTATMVHGLYQGQWVAADYTVGNWTATLPIDLLSTRNAGSTTWQQRLRSHVQKPNPAAALYGRSLYSPSGALVAVEIDPASGATRVSAIELILDAGKVLQPDLLTGQAQGGIAMGIGYALLENLPLLGDGAGDGRWNLDKYHVALASDVPLSDMTLTILPTNETTAKGIAEAVLCPIAPAIANAIAYATGKRFRSLPITPAQIKEALK